MRQFGFLFAVMMLLAVSCSREQKVSETLFFANVTVADSIDQTGDYSGFEIFVFNRLNIEDPIDTLLYAITDTAGTIEDMITVDEPGVYPAQISRYGRNLASFRLIVAENDTIRFRAEFPDVVNTAHVDSREQRAMNTYDRVESAYSRINSFIQAGQLSEDDILLEFQKFSDLYFDVFNDHQGTLAAKLALESGIILLNAFDEHQMFQRLQSSFNEEYAFGLAATYGKQYVAYYKGLEATVAYLDSVKDLTSKEDIQKAIDQSLVKLYLDSLEVENSKERLASYKTTYENEEDFSFWYKNIRFELYELTPGEPAPEFFFTTSEGDTVTNESLKGAPAVLEFTTMANAMYQQQYEESTFIYRLYADNGLQFYTIPFDESTVTIVSFYEERERFWSLADPPSFNKVEMIDDFNIQYYPTRILIDADGNIVRKYIGQEFEGMIPGITETLK